ncbi:hypothetical protein Unana1_05331 [Umbelopsis nana]
MASEVSNESVTANEGLRGIISKASTLVDGQLVANEKVNVSMKQEGKSLSEQLLERLEKLEISEDLMEIDEPKVIEPSDVQWRFVMRCLHYLQLIQQELNAKADSEEANDLRELLGVKDMRVVHTLLEIVITWGEYPQLLRGVGLPLKQRVKSGYSNRAFMSGSSTDGSNDKSLDMNRLLEIMTALTDIIESRPEQEKYTSVGSILINRHLIDIYAGLLQMAYAPYSAIEEERSEIRPIIEEIEEDQSASGSFQLKVPQTQIDREQFTERFQQLFKRVDSYKSMESLSLLLGTSPLHPVPAWLRSICGRFLSQVLLRPKGVSAVLDFTLGGVQEVNLAQMEKLSKLITTLPFQVRSVESYLSVICPQLIDIIKLGVAGPKSQVVSFIIGKLLIKYRTLSQKYLVDPISGSLGKAWDQDQYTPQVDDAEESFDPIVVSEETIQNMMTTVHALLASAEPSPEIIHAFLSTSITALYHLYQFSCQSKSSFKETTVDILTTYFRIVSTSDATTELKRILFDKNSDKRLAYFAPGPTGGVVMRLHKFVFSPKEITKLPVVAGDHLHVDTNIFVDLIQTIGIQNLCGDFFVAILNEYFSLQSESGRSVAPKTILMVLNLIMTMLDTLGPSILQNPTQIIAFASNVIDSHLMQTDHQNLRKPTLESEVNSGLSGLANLVSQEDESAKNFDEDDAAIMEDELSTLFLAVNLLGAVLNENDQLDKQARQLLTALLPKLQTLQLHPVPAIQESARELSLVIKSRQAEENVSSRVAGGDSNMQSSIEKYKQAMEALRDELMPVRAHGMGMLKDMILAKDPLVADGKGLDEVLDIFINMVQDDDRIITKLAKIYADNNRPLDHRLRVGEALQQTIQRSGDALRKYVDALLKPLELVLGNRQTDKHLRVSALSIIGVACQTCPVALTERLWSLMNWILTILEFEKDVEIRRAATVVILSLFRGLASQTLYAYPADLLKRTYRTLRYVEDTDQDELTRYQARVALSDLDTIMRDQIFH